MRNDTAVPPLMHDYGFIRSTCRPLHTNKHQRSRKKNNKFYGVGDDGWRVGEKTADPVEGTIVRVSKQL